MSDDQQEPHLDAFGDPIKPTESDKKEIAEDAKPVDVDEDREYLDKVGKGEDPGPEAPIEFKDAEAAREHIKMIAGFSELDRGPAIQRMWPAAKKLGFTKRSINNTIKQMVAALKKHRSTKENEKLGLTGPVLDKLDPFSIADEFTDSFYRDDQTRLLARFWRGQFYHFDEGQWIADITEKGELDDVFFAVQRWTKGCMRQGKEIIEPFKPKPADVSAIRMGVSGIVRYKGEDEQWIGRQKHPHVVPVNNGLLNPLTGELHPHDPMFFSTRKVHGTVDLKLIDDDDDFDAAAEKVVMPWLRQIFAGDLGQINALQQVFGYLLFGGNEMEKGFVIIGPARSGKGTLNKVLKHLMGNTACAPSTSTLASQFGAQCLLDKRLATITDMRVDNHTNFGDLAELLLKVSGGDPTSVSRKFLGEIDVMLMVRFLILSNSMPGLRDATGVLAQRFMYFETAKSFLGKENINLLAKLLEHETVWIAWALRGYQHLKSQGKAAKFHKSKTHVRLIDGAEAKMAPIETFLDRFMVRNSDEIIETEHVYLKFLNWAETIGIASWDKNKLNAKIREARPGVRIAQRTLPTMGRSETGELFQNHQKTHRKKVFIGLDWRIGEAPSFNELDEWQKNNSEWQNGNEEGG